LDNIAPQPLSNPTLIRRNPLLPYTELRQDFGKGKNRVKRAIPIPPIQKEVHAEMLARTDEVLKAYDEMMRASNVTLGDTVIHPAQLSCTRIFSKGTLTKGGRLYNFIQNKPEEVRVHINLNDEPTIEIDYWSIHPFLAYHQKGLHFNGDDPYTIDGFDRESVKTAFNIMVNRTGKGSSKSAAQTLAKELEIPLVEAKELEQAIQELHSPIADLFNSGAGLLMQRKDSDIALRVLETFTANNIPIIPIHDSFLVSVCYTEDLILTMRDYYMDELYGGSPPLDIQGFKGIKAESRGYTEPMMKAIQLCFEGDTEGMDNLYWDNLIAIEPVQPVPDITKVCIDEYA
jgi:hypothetical protein